MRYEYSCNIFNIWSTLRWNIPDLLSLAEPEQTLAPGAPSLPGTDWPVRPGPGRPNKPNPGEIRNISNITTLARSGQGAPTLNLTRSQFCNQKSRDTDLIFRALRNVEIENYVNVSFKTQERVNFHWVMLEFNTCEMASKPSHTSITILLLEKCWLGSAHL